MARVHEEIARLAEASAHDLRIEWRRHYRAEPLVRLSRDLLLRGVAYKLQEREHGGLSQMAKRTLRHLATKMENGDGDCVASTRPLAPGARLVRDWRGRSHTVTVLEDGFEYEGERYRSLSRIAKLITGVHWSGPRFFGLAGAQTRKPESIAVAAVVGMEASDGEG
jgi:hypothetical protein